jgi:hypothetical protein
LFPDRGCQAGSATSLAGWLAFIVQGLTYYDPLSFVFSSQASDMCGIDRPGGVFDHGEWISDRSARIADGDSKSLAAGVNGQDSHRWVALLAVN